MENSMLVLLSYACMHTHFQVEYICLACMYIWVCICRNNIYDRCLWKYIYPSIEQLQFSSEYFYSHWIGWMVNCKVERRLRKVKFMSRVSVEWSHFELKLDIRGGRGVNNCQKSSDIINEWSLNSNPIKNCLTRIIFFAYIKWKIFGRNGLP